ncbi:MAG: hypothetical protein AAF739_00390 [Pseudomonadota bacterium]
MGFQTLTPTAPKPTAMHVIRAWLSRPGKASDARLWLTLSGAFVAAQEWSEGDIFQVDLGSGEHHGLLHLRRLESGASGFALQKRKFSRGTGQYYRLDLGHVPSFVNRKERAQGCAFEMLDDGTLELVLPPWADETRMVGPQAQSKGQSAVGPQEQSKGQSAVVPPRSDQRSGAKEGSQSKPKTPAAPQASPTKPSASPFPLPSTPDDAGNRTSVHHSHGFDAAETAVLHALMYASNCTRNNVCTQLNRLGHRDQAAAFDALLSRLRAKLDDLDCTIGNTHPGGPLRLVGKIDLLRRPKGSV